MEMTHPEGAELQADVTSADWIAARLLPWGSGMGTRVCSVVPTGYDVYVRIFHHAGERIGTDRIRRRWAEVAQQTARRMHPLVQFERFGWQKQPRAGTLDREEASSLVSVLRRHTSTPEVCWLAIWRGYGMLSGGASALAFARCHRLRGWLRRRQRPTWRSLGPPDGLEDAHVLSLPAREYYVYRGPIGVVPRFEFLPDQLQTPNLWWPEDRAWFVATEIDFDSTLVACHRSCAEALLSSELEALQVSPDARLDIDGDTVNLRY